MHRLRTIGYTLAVGLGITFFVLAGQAATKSITCNFDTKCADRIAKQCTSGTFQGGYNIKGTTQSLITIKGKDKNKNCSFEFRFLNVKKTNQFYNTSAICKITISNSTTAKYFKEFLSNSLLSTTSTACTGSLIKAMRKPFSSTESYTEPLDIKLLAGLKQTQIALELYYTDNNHYPISTNTLTLGTGGATCLNASGWNKAGCSAPYSTSIINIPNHPFIYQSTSDGSTYTVKTVLAGDSSNVQYKGNITLTPNGITQDK